MSNASARGSSLTGRRCLVTGAAGYLGRRVVARLVTAGVDVTAQVRGACELPNGVRVRVSDMNEPGWADAARAEWCWDDVVHLAGPVAGGGGNFAEEAPVARSHATIALALARAIPPGWGGRLVHASSMTVYGAAPSLPVQEDQPASPRFPYALGKVLAEDVWRAAGPRDCWLLRLPGLFSAERRSGGLYHFVSAALARRPICINAREPTLWDILHVDDAAEAIMRALLSREPFAGAVNVSYGEVVELEAVARRISELTGGAPVQNETGVHHPPFQLDIRRARRLLADWPPYTLGERLEQFVAARRGAHG